jgi:hypothetical protein
MPSEMTWSDSRGSSSRISTPEERWWLFAMTVAEAGLPEDTQRGWRRALFHALSDGEKPATGRRRPRPVEADLFDLPLFAPRDPG